MAGFQSRNGMDYFFAVRRAVSRQQTANINAQHQKQSDLNPASPKKQAAVPAFFILNFFLKSADAVLPMYLWHLILYTSEITKNYENFLATGQV